MEVRVIPIHQAQEVEVSTKPKILGVGLQAQEVEVTQVSTKLQSAWARDYSPMGTSRGPSAGARPG